MYRGSKAKVRVMKQLSPEFEIKSGVRQGCLVSPVLFNLCLEWVLRKVARVEGGLRLSEGCIIRNPSFADDIDMINEDEIQREEKLYVLKEEGALVGLEISEPKTKTMEASRDAFRDFVPERSTIIAGLDIEETNRFKYLGSFIQPNND